MALRAAGVLRVSASRYVSAAEQVYGLPIDDTQPDPFAAINPRCAGKKQLSVRLEDAEDEPFIETMLRDGEISGYVQRQRNMVVMKKRK
jgi:hypothetical protein